MMEKEFKKVIPWEKRVRRKWVRRGSGHGLTNKNEGVEGLWCWRSFSSLEGWGKWVERLQGRGALTGRRLMTIWLYLLLEEM